jgi:hypothetical protein
MKVGIIYVTFARDIEWLRYSLESIGKYCSGFSGVTVVVPTWDFDKFTQFERYSTPSCPVRIKQFLEYPGRGFVHHLAMKCYADVFMPDMDVILHMDPDCLFCKPCTPDDYLEGGKPVLVVESFELLNKYFKERAFWKIGVDEALGIDAKFETMCRHPAAHVNDLYGKVRARVESVHGIPFMDYYLKGKNSFPQTRSEFPVLGAFAVEFMKDRYCFWDCSPERQKRLDEVIGNRELKIGHPESKLAQFWSYSGTLKNLQEIKKILE